MLAYNSTPFGSIPAPEATAAVAEPTAGVVQHRALGHPAEAAGERAPDPAEPGR